MRIRAPAAASLPAVGCVVVPTAYCEAHPPKKDAEKSLLTQKKAAVSFFSVFLGLLCPTVNCGHYNAYPVAGKLAAAGAQCQTEIFGISQAYKLENIDATYWLLNKMVCLASHIAPPVPSRSASNAHQQSQPQPRQVVLSGCSCSEPSCMYGWQDCHTAVARGVQGS